MKWNMKYKVSTAAQSGRRLITDSQIPIASGMVLGYNIKNERRRPMGCNNCGGGCGGSCGECAKVLELTRGEVDFLQELAIYAFLPVARKADDMAPFYPEGEAYSLEEYSAILMHLERKGLISLDYGAPVGPYPAELYEKWPVHGSVALTKRGQEVVESLSITGIS
jgi:hypothetical protein